jgi:hypothetical protein
MRCDPTRGIAHLRLLGILTLAIAAGTALLAARFTRPVRRPPAVRMAITQAVAARPEAKAPPEMPLVSPPYVDRCRLRSPMGPIDCVFGDPPDPRSQGMGARTSWIRFTWRTPEGSRRRNFFVAERGTIFQHVGPRVEVTRDAAGQTVLLVTTVWPGCSGSSLLVTALRLEPHRRAPRTLGHYDCHECPAGYLADARRGRVLFWHWVWLRGDHAHLNPFRVASFRIDRDRLTRKWSRYTRRHYPDLYEEEETYRRDRRQDPLREFGRRWPVQWTETWTPCGRWNVSRY